VWQYVSKTMNNDNYLKNTSTLVIANPEGVKQSHKKIPMITVQEIAHLHCVHAQVSHLNPPRNDGKCFWDRFDPR
jgi:hypothetical protein